MNRSHFHLKKCYATQSQRINQDSAGAEIEIPLLNQADLEEKNKYQINPPEELMSNPSFGSVRCILSSLDVQ